MRQPALLKSVACLLAGIALVGARALAADAPDASAADSGREKFEQQLRALNWVKGPATVELQGNSQLKLPEGYVYLDAKETAKFETLTENLGDGREVLVAPNDLRWSSFLEFDDGGYVKDDDKIDAPALAERMFWLRAIDRLADDDTLHRCLLAYLCDFQLLSTSVLPHEEALAGQRLVLASIDHAMWFHYPLRVDDWLLYVTDSPSASGSRGFARGSFYDRRGVLVASTAQEGLVRVLPPKD